jgi:hypothetical protein
MARPDLIPEPIGPARSLNRIGAAASTILAALPLYMGIDLLRLLLRDGALEYGLFPIAFPLILIAIGAALVGFGLWLWFKPTWRGLWVTFRPGGFSVRLLTIFGREKSYEIDWSDVEEMKLVVAPRAGAYLGFQLSHPAAVEAGLIQTTTRADAAKILVPRSVTLPVALAGLGKDDFLARFIASGEASGFRIEKASWREYLIKTVTTWAVSPSDETLA